VLVLLIVGLLQVLLSEWLLLVLLTENPMLV